MLAVLTNVWPSMTRPVDRHRPAVAHRPGRVGDRLQAEGVGEVVERAAGHDEQRLAGLGGDRRRGVDRAVAAGHPDGAPPRPRPSAAPPARSSPSSSSTTSASGSSARSSSAARSLEPADGLTTTTSPSPSGDGSTSAGFSAVRTCAGSWGATGHSRRVSRAAPTPRTAPAATSDGWWAPVWMREYPTRAARPSERGGQRRHLLAGADGEGEAGGGVAGRERRRRRLREAGKAGHAAGLGAGRRRRTASLTGPLATADASPAANRPRRAARRRNRPPLTPRAAAMASHSLRAVGRPARASSEAGVGRPGVGRAPQCPPTRR